MLTGSCYPYTTSVIYVVAFIHILTLIESSGIDEQKSFTKVLFLISFNITIYSHVISYVPVGLSWLSYTDLEITIWTILYFHTIRKSLHWNRYNIMTYSEFCGVINSASINGRVVKCKTFASKLFAWRRPKVWDTLSTNRIQSVILIFSTPTKISYHINAVICSTST